MPSRIIAESILWDERVQTLTPSAFSLYIKMLVMADDFGIGPAAPAELAALLRLQGLPLRNLSRNFPEIPGNGLARVAKFDGKEVYVIKPTSWDNYQWNFVRKRTKSRHLNAPLEIAQAFREWVWSTENDSLKNDSGNFPEFPGISRLARVSPPTLKSIEIVNITPDQNSEKENTKEVLNIQKGADEPQTYTGKIVETFHRIAAQTQIDAYNVSLISSAPLLHRAALTYGYKCLAAQAEKFEVWFVEQVRLEPAMRMKKHRPLARFLNNWMTKVDAELYTNGDTDSTPDTTHTAGQFAKFLQQDAA